LEGTPPQGFGGKTLILIGFKKGASTRNQIRNSIYFLRIRRGGLILKDEIMPKYASLIYNGYWWSPEREMLQALIDKTQEDVEGIVRLKLYKGNVMVVGRTSPKSLFSEAHSTS